MWQVIVFFVGWIIMHPAQAIIFGEPTPVQQVSTGQLVVDQLKWYGGTNSLVTQPFSNFRNSDAEYETDFFELQRFRQQFPF